MKKACVVLLLTAGFSVYRVSIDFAPKFQCDKFNIQNLMKSFDKTIFELVFNMGITFDT